ncbi:MAG: recombinase family protein [Thermotaleaceae bacterium]
MRCAIYARVSTEMETQKTSIAHQISYFERYLKEKGWELYKVYEDEESGTSIKKRGGLQQLLRDSRAHKFDMVLTKSISRFARNTLEGLTIVRELVNQNIRFAALEDGFDTLEYDEFMLTLFLSMAQKESEKMSQRIKFGKLCRARLGYFNGSIVPYGYKRQNKNQIVPAEDLSTYVVQRIFRLYLEGYGLYKIAKELNANQYPTPSQRAQKKGDSSQWHQSTIRKILTNPVYVGDMVQNKSFTKNLLTGIRTSNSQENFISIEGTHPAIVDRVSFNEVQRLLAIKGNRPHSHQKNMFSGMLLCGECGSAMHYKKNKKRYLCGRVNKHGKESCLGSSIGEESLIAILKEDLRNIFSEQLQEQAFLEKIEKEVAVIGEEQSWKKIEHQLLQAEKQKKKLIELLLLDMIDSEDYHRKRQQLLGEIQILKEKKEGIQQKKEAGKMLKEKKTLEILGLETLDREILQKLIESIRIYHNDRIEIGYRFSQ